MFDRFLDRYSDFVTRRRALVLGCVAAFVAFCASQLPRLQLDPSPENLLVSFEGYGERQAHFQELFGDPDSVVVLLVEADDVLQRVPLDYVHLLSRHFKADPSVVRVESLTVTPLPGAQREDTATLEDLDDLDALEEEPAIEPRTQAALETLIASEPDRFPLGLQSIAERVGDGSSELEGVVQGDEVTEAEADSIRAAVADLPLVDGRLVSRDHRLAAVVLFLDPQLGTGEARLRVVHAIDEWLLTAPPPDGVELVPAGIPHLRAAISDAMLADQVLLVPLSLLVCVLMLFASFRWLPGTFLPLATVAISVIGVLGLMAFVGEPMTILMNTLPTLLIIMGISEAVHVIGRYVEEARRTPDRVVASRKAIRSLMIACFLTSFTTAVGFASLLVARTDMLRRFGLVASLGVMITYLVLITFVPAAVAYFRPPAHAPKDHDALPHGALEAILLRVTQWVVSHPRGVIAVVLLCTLPCAWAYNSVRVDTALLDTFDHDDPIVHSTRLMEEHLDGIRPLEILVETDEEGRLRDPQVLAALDRIAAYALEQEGVLRATTPGDFLWEAWRRIAGIGKDDARPPFHSREQIDALTTLVGRIQPSPLENFVTADGRHARVEIRLADVGAQRSIELVEAIDARAAQELAPLEGTRYGLLGEAFIGSHGIDSVVQDMFGSLTLSALVIFLTIGLLFRSPRLGLLSIPPNVIPQLTTVGWMVVRGIPLNASTAIVFSVVIGVTVDLTIHAFARLVEERERGLNPRAAILRAARGTGRAIVVASGTLVLGFAVLLLSGFVPVRHFGELIAAALLMSLLVTLIFQPAMLTIFGASVLRQRPKK